MRRKPGQLVALAAAAALTAGSAAAGTVVFNEGFDSGLPASWQALNFSDFPSGAGWFQGYSGPSPFFPAHSGAPTSYLASSVYIGAQTVSGEPEGIIDGELRSPSVSLDRDLVLKFWTRSVAANTWPEYLYVGLLVNSRYTTLLELNPSLDVGAYPEDWTQYMVHIDRRGAGVSGRVIFDYFSPDGARYGNYIGLDSVSLEVPEPGGWLAIGGALFAAGLATRRSRR